ncbi:conserved Plasmodium protein, unknown function [Plasmodium vivax]|uniref:Uncharacterized protein n=2 Tax=Plasmodium vivax TaxID=5855 RepID=A0A0J9W7D2_PLAVI|nr:hypothetical protein PVNG_01980 [Plasmodium vivax North Korean]CAG9472585.1 unnamed protein product [Plasmodium vivax]SCO75743.1 conserved Plasmodium protein, unknown function [Plasmodium vivax]
MEKTTKRSRGSLTILLDTRYNNRQKEKEIKLFENIKTDISIIISEQLKKRSKTEFELNNVKKKFSYLKCMTEELERLIKEGNRELKVEEELIKNYFEYTTTNLSYVFIKYENIISDLSDQNGNMNVKLKNIKENELANFDRAYESLLEKTGQLTATKENIISVQKGVENLKKEYEHVQAEIEIKREEKSQVENKYKELLTRIEEYKKEFDMIKEKCNSQMNEKKQSSIDLNKIEEQMEEMQKEISSLSTERKIKNDELGRLKDENDIILSDLYRCNAHINDKCDLLSAQIGELQNEVTSMEEEKNELSRSYHQLEIDLTSVSHCCEESKRENEQESLLIKELSDELIKKKTNLKQTQEQYSHISDQCSAVKNENAKLRDSYNNLHRRMEAVGTSISECRASLQGHEAELAHLENVKLENEKKKEEMLKLMENSEKLLLEQKDFFFKLSKLVQLVNLSNEQLANLKRETEEGPDENDVQRIHEELKTHLEKLSADMCQKNEMHNSLQNEIDETAKRVSQREEEIATLGNEQADLQHRLEMVDQELGALHLEVAKQGSSWEAKIKETKDALTHKYDQLEESIASQIKSKQDEHNNFVKQGELEKLEFDFQLFRSELTATLEQECERKRRQIAEKDAQLKAYQERYTLLKGI